jgi:hypothetical protein
MVNVSLTDCVKGLRCRAIAACDLADVIALLAKGFGFRRNRAFWRHVMATLQRFPAPQGLPQFGYLLEQDGRPVGVLLLICSMPGTGSNQQSIRCNLSSWYVEPSFRSYATLLAAQAMRHKAATYLNISPATNTMAIIRAQKYVRYSSGLFIATPALQRRSTSEDAAIAEADGDPGPPFRPCERDLLVRHGEYGCLSFWCVTGSRAYPFVFRRRLAKGVLPCAQLIYCRDIADVARFAGLIGCYLLRHGCPLVLIDANGAVPGLLGRYFDGLMPKYYRGPDPVRLGDLAYTEAALFGMWHTYSRTGID